jgi:hypothetical protein
MKPVSGAVCLASTCNSIVLMRSAPSAKIRRESSLPKCQSAIERMDILKLPGLAIFARATEAFCATGCFLWAHANGPS